MSNVELAAGLVLIASQFIGMSRSKYVPNRPPAIFLGRALIVGQRKMAKKLAMRNGTRKMVSPQRATNGNETKDRRKMKNLKRSWTNIGTDSTSSSRRIEGL